MVKLSSLNIAAEIDALLVTSGNLDTILHHLWATVTEKPKFATFIDILSFNFFARGDPFEFLVNLIIAKTRVLFSVSRLRYLLAYKVVLTQCQRVTDEQTNERRPDGNSRARA